VNFDTWVIGEYGTTITDPKILALMDSAWQAARRTVSGQEAVGEIEQTTLESSDGERLDFTLPVLNDAGLKLPIGSKLYAAPIPATELSVRPLTVSQAPTSQYAMGWNDCLRAIAAKEPK
jgi:hypothetical protein